MSHVEFVGCYHFMHFELEMLSFYYENTSGKYVVNMLYRKKNGKFSSEMSRNPVIVNLCF